MNCKCCRDLTRLECLRWRMRLEYETTSPVWELVVGEGRFPVRHMRPEMLAYVRRQMKELRG